MSSDEETIGANRKTNIPFILTCIPQKNTSGSLGLKLVRIIRLE
jgi:hypothetical protein